VGRALAIVSDPKVAFAAAASAVGAQAMKIAEFTREAWKRLPANVAPLFALLLVVMLFRAGWDAVVPGLRAATDNYVIQITSACVGLLILWGAKRAKGERAWLSLGVGTIFWAASWAVFDFGPESSSRLVLSECLTLVWYLLALVALIVLIRPELPRFDESGWERWLDGFAFGLAAATPLVAALLIGIHNHHTREIFAFEAIAHPVIDIVALAGVLGLIGVTQWQLPRSWYWLTLGLVVWALADAIWSVSTVGNARPGASYYYLWTVGLLLIAYAAWLPSDERGVDSLSRWRLLLIPVACQVAVIVTQVWALIGTLSDVERIMTIVLVVVVTVQICLRHLGSPDERKTPVSLPGDPN
jgi:hypothetical protein